MSRSISISIPDVSKARRAANASNQKQNIDENDIHNFLPLTPQRLNRSSKQLRSVTSPITPRSTNSSPFTPITNRYSPASSITTPSSSVSSKTKVDSSPELAKSSGQKSPADSIGNWRVRSRDASNTSVQSKKEGMFDPLHCHSQLIFLSEISVIKQCKLSFFVLLFATYSR